MIQGPSLQFSQELHAEKYRGQGESFREAMNRVASAVSDSPDHYHAFRDILLSMRFLPAGRVQSAMGATRQVTPYNCFVSGTLEDSFVAGNGSIMQRATEAAATMRLGGGIGYDFSTLRPRGASIRKLQSRSSGPLAFMEIYDAICRCVASSGHRRGAQMGVMRIDHPDVLEFVRAKQNSTKLTGFNISLAVTDEFMHCLQDNRPFRLRFGGETYNEVNPHDLWETIMRSTWDWAEPGVLFIDRINDENNLGYCETIAATNPCGEQPLPPFGACLLGSFNLPKYVEVTGLGFHLNLERLVADMPAVVRAMDNVVDRAIYPLYEHEKEAKSKRRMGLGITGLANAIEATGHPYGSRGFCERAAQVMEALRNAAYRASVELAREKGSFPALDCPKYLDSPFIQRLPAELRAAIQVHGIRNSHLISIAPTGTISLCADNVSSGVEPVFSHAVERQVHMTDGLRFERVEDYGWRVFGVEGKTSDQVSANEHLAVLAVLAPYVDSAISKTCNVPSDMPWEDFKSLYVRAWQAGCKGLTTFQVGGKRAGIMVTHDGAPVVEAEEDQTTLACRIDQETGRRECE